jgi:hypothetical protein
VPYDNYEVLPTRFPLPKHLSKVVQVFEKNNAALSDDVLKGVKKSHVLKIVKKGLRENGFAVEESKKAKDKIRIGSFNVDAYQKETGTIIDIEAGRAHHNYEFLKALFESCIIKEANYLVIAVPTQYTINGESGEQTEKTFDSVIKHFDDLYASDRLKLPLKGVLIIGY